MAQNEYDVIIIGSGIGGMAAAALLAKKGVKTLVIESKERLGGRFSTINYEGFKLPTGAQLVHEQGWMLPACCSTVWHRPWQNLRRNGR